jgi:hypothetical protein
LEKYKDFVRIHRVNTPIINNTNPCLEYKAPNNELLVIRYHRWVASLPNSAPTNKSRLIIEAKTTIIASGILLGYLLTSIFSSFQIIFISLYKITTYLKANIVIIAPSILLGALCKLFFPIFNIFYVSLFIFISLYKITKYLADNAFNEDLNNWVKSAPKKKIDDYKKAKEKILEAKKNRNTKNGVVDLSNLLIESLPICLVNLLQPQKSPYTLSLHLANTSIDHLPQGLQVNGDLKIIQTNGVSSSLQSLPNGLKIDGNLSLKNLNINSLCKDLYVGGNLEIIDCLEIHSVETVFVKETACFSDSSIQRIHNVTIGKNLLLNNMKNLTTLNNISVALLEIENAPLLDTITNIQVRGNLTVNNASQLFYFNDTNSVGGDITFSKCTSLKVLSIFENKVKGNLTIVDTGLYTLPESLYVNKSLTLISCKSLFSLPKNLQIGDSLLCLYCSIANINKGLVVGSSADFTNCSILTFSSKDTITFSKPSNSYKFTWSDDTPLVSLLPTVSPLPTLLFPNVNIPQGEFIFEKPEVSKTIKKKLLNLYPQWTIRTISSSPLEKEFLIWEKMTKRSMDLRHFILSIEDVDETPVVEFLKKIRKSAECLRNPEALAIRVLELFSTIAENIADQQLIITLMRQGQETCEDRAITSFSDLEIQMELYKLKRDVVDENTLESKAKSYFLLELVDKKAVNFIQKKGPRLPVEEHLFIRLEMAKKFSLPLKTTTMLYGHETTKKELETIKREIDEANTEEALKKFKSSWPPFLAFQRRSSVPRYQDLELFTGDHIPEYRCIITFNEKEEIENPVICRSHVYSFDALKQIFIDNGKDPADRQLIDWSLDVKRLPPFESNTTNPH